MERTMAAKWTYVVFWSVKKETKSKPFGSLEAANQFAQGLAKHGKQPICRRYRHTTRWDRFKALFGKAKILRGEA